MRWRTVTDGSPLGTRFGVRLTRRGAVKAGPCSRKSSSRSTCSRSSFGSAASRRPAGSWPTAAARPPRSRARLPSSSRSGSTVGVAAPAFVMAFAAGLIRVLMDPQVYLKAHWFHGKLTLALVVIALHHILGARAARLAKSGKDAASSQVGPEGSREGILTGALVLCALGRSRTGSVEKLARSLSERSESGVGPSCRSTVTRFSRRRRSTSRRSDTTKQLSSTPASSKLTRTTPEPC